MKLTNPRITQRGGKNFVFDHIRKKYLVLTPEEWVRQKLLIYLCNEKHYPINLIRVEQKLLGKDMYFRADLVIYNRNGKPLMIIECKAENVTIGQDVFDQIAKYNMYFKVDYLLVTNGKQHYVCKIDHELKSFEFLKNVPDYEEIC